MHSRSSWPRRRRFATSRALLAPAAFAAMLATALVVSACATTGQSGSAAGDLGLDEWHLLDVGGHAALPADIAERPSLRFEADSSRASGNGGCNRFSGTFTQNGKNLVFGPLLSTKMACVDVGLTRQEQEYLSALQSTNRFEISADTLTLFRSVDQLARLVR